MDLPLALAASQQGRRPGAGTRRGTTTRCCTGRSVCSQYASASQIWINPFKLRVRVDLWQGLRADLNDHAFGAFDLLLRVEESRILLQRRQDRLVESKSWNPAALESVPVPASLDRPRTPKAVKIPRTRKNFLIHVWRLDARTAAPGFNVRHFIGV